MNIENKGPQLDLKFDGHVVVLTLSNPPKRNALGQELLDAISDACADAARRGIRAMVLRAEAGARVWSAGHDIDEFVDGNDPLAFGSPLERAIRALRMAPFPVIAMIQGSVWGGAVELVLSCDIVIADDSASFAITPANLGLPYNLSGLLHFIGRLPVHRVKEMFFTAMPVSATDALEWGLINHLETATRIEARCMAMAMQIATKAPLAITAVKEQLRIISDLRPIPAESLDRISELRQRAWRSSDFSEGLAAFREKRKPTFNG